MTRSTQQVFDDHISALARYDVPAIMADYADDAVLMTIDRVCVGKAEIEAFFVATFAAMPELTFQPTGLQVHGDLALASWTADSATVRCPAGNDTFVIRDDRILMQTACFTAVPK
jgi:ketosteroid isomerase-like protein